jgi:prolyl-tRNA synthetase
VIVPIYNDQNKAQVLEAARRLQEELQRAGLRIKLDDREWLRPGFKFNDWELRGVPVRLELGPRDLESGQAMISRRDQPGKQALPLATLADSLKLLLDQIQAAMLAQAEQSIAGQTTEVNDYEQFKELLESKKGFFIAGWDGSAETEALIKEETKATIRCLPLEGGEPGPGLKDPRSGAPAQHRVIYARAY